jgi:hypothetical protein
MGRLSGMNGWGQDKPLANINALLPCCRSIAGTEPHSTTHLRSQSLAFWRRRSSPAPPGNPYVCTNRDKHAVVLQGLFNGQGRKGGGSELVGVVGHGGSCKVKDGD